LSHARLSQCHAQLTQSYVRLTLSHARSTQLNGRLALYHAMLTKSYIGAVSRRFARYHSENGVEMRTLYKAFGIRFDVMVFGKVG
jgi:hypothetical protein